MRKSTGHNYIRTLYKGGSVIFASTKRANSAALNAKRKILS
jgi:hypothetical protein